MKLVPLANDSLRGSFTMSMGRKGHGTTTLHNDTIIYVAPTRFSGVDSINYILENANTRESGLILISIAYDCVTVIRNDDLIIDEGAEINFSPIQNDSLCSSLFTVNIQALSSHGVTASPTNTVGTFRFHSSNGRFEADTFRYNVYYSGGQIFSGKVNVSVRPDTACANTLYAYPDSGASTSVNNVLSVPYSELTANDIFCLNDLPFRNITVAQNTNVGTISYLSDGFLFRPKSGTQGQTAVLSYTITSLRNPRKSSTSFLKIRIY
jgi:hypothetical protein